MFFDNFMRECDQKNVSPTKALTNVGLRTTLYTYWKQNRLQGKLVQPVPDTIRKLAEYFGCSEDDLTRDDYRYKPQKSWSLIPESLQNQVRSHVQKIMNED